MKAKDLECNWQRTNRNKQKIKEKQAKAAANKLLIESVLNNDTNCICKTLKPVIIFLSHILTSQNSR